MIEGVLRRIAKRFVSRKRGAKLRLMYERLASQLYRDLVKLAVINKADKWGAHRYAAHYARHLERYRRQPTKLLEIGTGGYDDPTAGGQGARMWRSFFRKGQVISLDCHEKRLDDHRVTYVKGSQDDRRLLRELSERFGPFDIVVDDGSHVNDHQRISFETLFPLLADGGMYCIEDLQTSYWPSRGGDSVDRSNPRTTINFLKSLVDGLNHKEFICPEYSPTCYDLTIVAIHFYHNLCLIEKGTNDEASNVVEGNAPNVRVS